MRIKKNSLSYYLLLALEKTVDGMVRANDYAYHSYIYAAGYDRPLKQSALSQAIKRLREKGFIGEEVDEDKVIIKLTDVGREVLGIDYFDEKEWDGGFTIVIFDIPENKKAIRDLLRRKLKKWRFVKWQKSVWVTKRKVAGKLREYIKELGISHWVVVIESNNVDSDNIIFSDRVG